MHVSTYDQIKYIKQIKFSFGFVQRTADVVKIMHYPSFVRKRFLHYIALRHITYIHTHTHFSNKSCKCRDQALPRINSAP